MKNTRIVLAGGSGFLGQALSQYFQNKGAVVIILTRHPKKDNHIYWDGQTVGKWVKYLNQNKATQVILINLAGKSVDCRYHAENRKAILTSRLDSTNVLNMAIKKIANPPSLWLNASSATTYIHAETQKMTEKDGIIGDDFSMGVCKQWEAAFFSNNTARCRKVAMRTSIVLGQNGGAFPKLKLLTQLGLGGKINYGTQMVSWIHLKDFCRITDFIINQPTLHGAINVTSPAPIANSDFMLAFRNRYHRKFGLRIGRPLLEIGAWLARTETELLLKSRYVFPAILLESGFEFEFPRIEEALGGL